MLFLWYVSFLISIICLIAGVVKRSWSLSLISTIAFVPIALYFAGAVNAWKYIGWVPVALLAVTIYLWLWKREAGVR